MEAIILEDNHGEYYLSYSFMEMSEKLKKFKAGENVTVTVKEIKKNGSHEQRKYYFGVIIKILCQELWGDTSQNAKDDMHREIKRLILGKKDDRTGFLRVPKYRDMNSAERERYHSLVRATSSRDFCVWLPQPNEVYKWEMAK